MRDKAMGWMKLIEKTSENYETTVLDLDTRVEEQYDLPIHYQEYDGMTYFGFLVLKYHNVQEKFFLSLSITF